MTTEIVYDGGADVQEFSKDDFAKEGVDAKKISFNKGEVTEVDDAVAELLLEGTGVFDGFKFREPKKGDTGYKETDDDAASKAKPTGSGTVQESTGGPAAPATGGTSATAAGTGPTT